MRQEFSWIAGFAAAAQLVGDLKIDAFVSNHRDYVEPKLGRVQRYCRTQQLLLAERYFDGEQGEGS